MMQTGQESHRDMAWYIIRTYPGYENKTKDNLQKRLRAIVLRDRVVKIVIPIDEEIYSGEYPVLPGFLLLRMQMSAEVWRVVRNTVGVTGFVGMGNTPTPFLAEDWRQIPINRFTGEM